MHFTANTKDLANALKLAVDCCPAKATVPILNHIKIEAYTDVDGLAITASDLDREVTIRCAANVQERGVEAIDGKMLRDIASRAGGDEIVVQSEPGRVRVSSGRSNFRVPTLPPADFPSIGKPEDAAEFILTSGEFQWAAGVAIHAAADGIGRTYLNGVHLCPEGKGWVCVATDGHRLVKAFFAAPAHGGNLTPLTLPTKTVSLINRLFPGKDDVTFRASKRLIVLSSSNASLASKLIDGSFPDYNRLIPATNQTMQVEKADLAAALNRVTVFGITNPVRLSFADGVLSLYSRSTAGADAESTDEIEAQADKPFEVAVQASYLTDALAIFEDGKLCMDFTGYGNPIMFHGARYGMLELIMPKRW